MGFAGRYPVGEHVSAIAFGRYRAVRCNHVVCVHYVAGGIRREQTRLGLVG